MRFFIALTFGIVFLAITLLPLHPQGVTAQRPAFEVASIKPNKSQARRRVEYQPGGRFTATNYTLRDLIVVAYFIAPFQLAERSDWIDSDGYDVDAKPPANMIPARPIDRETNAKIREMLQALLGERFHLRLHWESKEMPVYELVVAKGGPKLRYADVNRDCRVVSNYYCHGISGGPDLVTGHTVTMADLADALTLLVVTGDERRVIDKTGLQGAFDVELRWTNMTVPLRPELSPNAAPGPEPGPSIFTALQEQLGLKLESAKGLVDVLVIDSAEKPTEN